MKALEAVIEIGSTALRLMVCELKNNNEWFILDKSELPVSLGWDVFTTGTVSKESLLQCLRTLNRFKEQLSGWDIDVKQVTIIATSALREAKNKDIIVDRIFIKTGFRVKIIDGIEENRLMYLAVLDVLRMEYSSLQKENTVILEIGGGSTEIMLLNKGKMAAVHSFRLGTVIIEQYIKSMLGSSYDVRRFLEDFIKNAGLNLNIEVDMAKIHQFITIGSEAQIAAREIGKKVGARTWIIEREAFNKFVNQVQEYSIEESMAWLKISYIEAKSLAISLLTYKLFIDLTTTEHIIVFNTTIREGLLLSKLSGQTELEKDFFSQVVASALNIGRRYRIDEAHALYVRNIALQIYDQMSYDLGLAKETRLILEIAALLHDIGAFIRGSDHHLHSEYIILHSEIFGLNKETIKIVALVARYHRGSMPLLHDSVFLSLSRDDRNVVSKLAAILRLADALDRSHRQRVKKIKLVQQGETLLIQAVNGEEMQLEKLAVAEKGDLFESVFGYSLLVG